MSLVLAAIAAATASHSVQIEHRGTPIEAIYSARTDIRTRTIGAHTPNRMDNRRCRWTATIMVERRLTHGPALARTLPGERQFSGSRPGACPREAASIQREVARRDGEIRAHLLAVAERDRGQLLAELDNIKTLATG
jgi:hypothetical protein